jgi:hypothetical protein
LHSVQASVIATRTPVAIRVLDSKVGRKRGVRVAAAGLEPATRGL